MKKVIILLSVSLFLITSLPVEAKRKQSLSQKRRSKMTSFIQLKRAIKQSSQGDYVSSTKNLFRLMYKPSLKNQKNKIRYHLALNLYNMGLYHPAIFQFQTLLKSNAKGYVGKSLQKIALAAAYLKDDRLLHHAISHGSLKYISRLERDKLYYHFGEYWMRKRKFRRASANFSRVKSSSPYFYKALYQLGLVHAELNRTSQSVRIFSRLESRRAGITDSFRVAAIMGKARSYYQGKRWEESIDAYRQVPKDSPFWHDTLLEISWALLRAGKLRSALSNFQTLHSSYYEGYYQPESLLLRSIIYLYICKHYEMEKVLDLFHRVYRPVYTQVRNLVSRRNSMKSYYQSLVLSADQQSKGRIVHYPTPVARRILREGDFSALHHYVTKLKEERDLIYSLPYSWRRSMVGQYSQKLITRRLNNAQKKAGKRALSHLKIIRAELKDFFTQEQYLRYEMLRSKRGFLKQKIAEKITTGVSIEDFDRSFYIQNGYEYWPFQGEYWLDELGNYHYIGKTSCRR